MEDTLRTQLNDEQLAYTSTQKGANMKASMDTRNILLDNQKKVYDQDNQLNRIKGTADETYGLMVDTNQDLRGQRELIEDARKKALDTEAQVAKTQSLIK